MINYHQELVSVLSAILPTHYELSLHSGIETPCISYQERNNYSSEQGDTLGYSHISYTIKVWSKDITEVQNYILAIDAALRPLGFRRTSTQELWNIESTMLQKIMNYECLALENY